MTRFDKIFKPVAKFTVEAREVKKSAPTPENRFSTKMQVQYFDGTGKLLIFPNLDGPIEELEEGMAVHVENDGYPQTVKAPTGEYQMPNGMTLHVEDGKIIKIDLPEELQE